MICSSTCPSTKWGPGACKAERSPVHSGAGMQWNHGNPFSPFSLLLFNFFFLIKLIQCLFNCMHLFVCVYMYMCMLLYMYTQTLGILLYHSLPYFLKTGSLTELGGTLVASCLWPWSPVLGYRYMCSHTQGQGIRTQVSMLIQQLFLPSETSLQSSIHFLK